MRRPPRFFSPAALRAATAVRLSEDAGHHAVRVLRLRAGDGVVLFDGTGGEYEAVIASVQKATVEVEVREHRPVERESPVRSTLVQGVSSGERMEFTIRKAVELGVGEIVPVLCSTSVARPKGERAASRHAHWQKIAVSACEQCGRNRIPVVRALAASVHALAWEAFDGARILLDPDAAESLSRIVRENDPGGFLFAAGPEAGFDESEEGAFLRNGFRKASLGPRVLRTETAGLAALAALNALRGDF